ncbi:MAG: hypothetical protein DSM106950_28945 [Stigonema ocellatum SAG 48.90 = DSM 106950]|nr:hypothetical protein [Stigonema ocellatum SAG 48.90 = DSM 106950]
MGEWGSGGVGVWGCGGVGLWENPINKYIRFYLVGVQAECDSKKIFLKSPTPPLPHSPTPHSPLPYLKAVESVP